MNAFFALFNGFLPPAALAAVLFGLAFLFRRARFGPYAFLIGVFGASTVAILLLALMQSVGSFANEETLRFFTVLVWGPVVEEAIKLGFLGLLIWLVQRKDKARLPSWVLYGALMGYGFAAAEGFVFFFEDHEEELREGVLLTRWLGTSQMHALSTAVAGLIVGSGTRFIPSHGAMFRVMVALVAAAAIHATWNCLAGGMQLTGRAGLSQTYAVIVGVVFFAAIIGTWSLAEMVKSKSSSDTLTQ